MFLFLVNFLKRKCLIICIDFNVKKFNFWCDNNLNFRVDWKFNFRCDNDFNFRFDIVNRYWIWICFKCLIDWNINHFLMNFKKTKNWNLVQYWVIEWFQLIRFCINCNNIQCDALLIFEFVFLNQLICFF